jgi:hypothetical protein
LAENPLATLARVLGGVVLTQGSLGHQVLGQLLIMNTNEVAMAAAAAVVAGTSGQRSAVGQIALRTVAPALAVRVLLNKQEERLNRKSLRLDDRERELIRQRIRVHRLRRKLRDEQARAGRRRVEASVPPTPGGPISAPGTPESTPASIPVSHVLASPPAPDAATPVAPLSPVAAAPAPPEPEAALAQVSGPAAAPEPAPRARRRRAPLAKTPLSPSKPKAPKRSRKSPGPTKRGGAKKR